MKNYLYHHGVKGQKWGVRRGPPYPLKETVENSKESDNIVTEAICSGKVKKEINQEKQIRHTKHGHPKGKSYLDGDLEYAQSLIDKLCGTGRPILDKNGNWTMKERVVDPHIIGTHVDAKGNESKTNCAMIVYSKTGAHIYPRKKETK